MFSCGKSWSSSSEALRLRALFSRQAAWQPGAFVDKLCQRRSVHARCWGSFMVERARRVRA